MTGQPPEPGVMTAPEYDRFEQLEAVVQSGLQGFLEVGNALVEIRDSRLYRESHATFEAYCRERWEITKSRAYQLIGAAETVQHLSTVVDTPTPANEGQARALRQFEPDLQPVIMRTAEAYSRSTGKPLTAGMIERTGAVIEEAVTTGYVDPGTGESTPLVAAMHVSEFEATQRLRQGTTEFYEKHDARGHLTPEARAERAELAAAGKACPRCGHDLERS